MGRDRIPGTSASSSHHHPSARHGGHRRSQQEEARAQGDSGPRLQGLKGVVQDPHPPLLLLLPRQPGDPSPLAMKARQRARQVAASMGSQGR